MRIGFYAPLKAPDHPVPSGDRQMARLLLAALRTAGHVPEVYSGFRSFAATPDTPRLDVLRAAAEAEFTRIEAAWADPARRPELLFTYHLYYKAPDLLGPRLAARFALPFVTAEASLSARRADGAWAGRQALVAEAVRAAALNLCLTARDRAGLAGTADAGSLVDLLPFIDVAPFQPLASKPPDARPVRLVTVAMMRPGDKADSYRHLGEALRRVPGHWFLTVIGDGPARAAVHEALADLGTDRVTFLGALPSEAVPERLRAADLFVWPGLGEAFGLCYLEAQACGLPVVAVGNAGTPSVVRDGETGVLTAAEPAAYAAAVARLVTDAALRRRLGAAATAFVHGERSLTVAAGTLDAALRRMACRHNG